MTPAGWRRVLDSDAVKGWLVWGRRQVRRSASALRDRAETGLHGPHWLSVLSVVLVFFAWWFVQTKQIWSSVNPDLLPRAATIASAAILAHSIVDYPLRTAAISAVLAFCLGVMATSGRSSARTVHPSQRNTRHVRIA